MRVGIVADIHEDIVRLREALAVLDARRCGEIVCLGDSVGFAVPYFAHFGTRDASAVLALLRQHCALVLAGNHDLFAVRKLPEHRAVLYSHYAYPDLVGATVFEVTAPADASRHLAYMSHHGCALGVSGHDHFEGLKVFTADTIRALPFGAVRLDRVQTWLHGPAVVNGTYANGVMVLDTETLEVEAIPLGSERHELPAWRGPWRG